MLKKILPLVFAVWVGSVQGFDGQKIPEAELTLLTPPPGYPTKQGDGKAYQLAIRCAQPGCDQVDVEVFQRFPATHLAYFTARRSTLENGHRLFEGDGFRIVIGEIPQWTGSPRSRTVVEVGGTIPGTNVSMSVFALAFELNPTAPHMNIVGDDVRLVTCEGLLSAMQ